jgi:hypothetical protein
MAKARWIREEATNGEFPLVDAFLMEVIEVCKKYGMSISHEDSQGAFVIEPLNQENIRWLFAAGLEKRL